METLVGRTGMMDRMTVGRTGMMDRMTVGRTVGRMVGRTDLEQLVQQAKQVLQG
jgi:hypothetical protein